MCPMFQSCSVAEAGMPRSACSEFLLSSRYQCVQVSSWWGQGLPHQQNSSRILLCYMKSTSCGLRTTKTLPGTLEVTQWGALSNLLCLTIGVWRFREVRSLAWGHSEESGRAKDPNHVCWLPAWCCLHCIELFPSHPEEDTDRLIMWPCCIRNIYRIKHVNATSTSLRTGGRSNLSAVAFVNTAWRTHQEASEDPTGSICLVVKTREIPGGKKMDWRKGGRFQVNAEWQEDGTPVSWARVILSLSWMCGSVGSATTFSSVFLTG